MNGILAQLRQNNAERSERVARARANPRKGGGGMSAGMVDAQIAKRRLNTEVDAEDLVRAARAAMADGGAGAGAEEARALDAALDAMARFNRPRQRAFDLSMPDTVSEADFEALVAGAVAALQRHAARPPRAPAAPAPRPAESGAGAGCTVCMEPLEGCRAALAVCGHASFCLACANILAASGSRECPVCKTHIHFVLRLYL